MCSSAGIAEPEDHHSHGPRQGHGTRPAPPGALWNAEQPATKRIMLLVDAKIRDAHVNKAVRQLRLEGSKYDVLVTHCLQSSWAARPLSGGLSC